MICYPGTCWSYAHTNFVILGKVLEKATGRPLEDLIKEGILDPLSLKDTRSEVDRYHPGACSPLLRCRTRQVRGVDLLGPVLDARKRRDDDIEHHRHPEERGRHRHGTLVSPHSHSLQLAPLTAKFKPWSQSRFYAFGVFVDNGWVVQNPSFAGYAATMTYLPSWKLAVAVSVTAQEKSSLNGNLSTNVMKDIAVYLAPDAPLK